MVSHRDSAYSLTTARRADGSPHHVIADSSDRLHESASKWLAYLADMRYSTNTIQQYGRRLAAYLSWTATTTDWRSVSLGHLVLWRRTLAATPIVGRNGSLRYRTEATVGLWLTPIRAFYEWADAQSLLTSDIANQVTEDRYFPPGSAAGGEHGRRRRVLVRRLAPAKEGAAHKKVSWIDDAGARQRLLDLDLSSRDRFIVDLLYFTGIRAGEALSLFTADMHLGGGSKELGCRILEPHFHVRTGNPVENGARAKGRERVLFTSVPLVDRYIDYVIARSRALSAADECPHVLVNLYTEGTARGRAMTYSGMRKLLVRCGTQIGFAIDGPHVLRHTFATRLVRGIECEQTSLDVVQDLLGHRSIESTRLYTHDRERAMQAALLALQPRSISLLGTVAP